MEKKMAFLSPYNRNLSVCRTISGEELEDYMKQLETGNILKLPYPHYGTQGKSHYDLVFECRGYTAEPLMILKLTNTERRILIRNAREKKHIIDLK